MPNRMQRHTSGFAVTVGAAALAASSLLAGQAAASPLIDLCHTAGHPATSAEIINRAETRRVPLRTELTRLQGDYDQASTASPATWRLRAELDRLGAEARDLEDMQTTAFIRGDATPGSPAQFRAQEELDAACNSFD